MPRKPRYIPWTADRIRTHYSELVATGGPHKLWAGAIDGQGYGIKYNGHHQMHAHRWTWIEAYGPIPDDIHVRHKCDVKACVNLHHLELGTAADNMRDAAERGQGSPHADNMRDAVERRHRTPSLRGEAHPNAKLTDEDVLAIRASTLSGRRLASMFGVSDVAICSVRNGKRWSHVAGPDTVERPKKPKREWSPKGSGNANEKLTTKQIREIAVSGKSQQEIMKEYGLSRGAVAYIRSLRDP